MSLLTILSLIGAAIKIITELSAWLAAHPEVTAAMRSRIDEMRSQATDISVIVEDLRESHARVEAP